LFHSVILSKSLYALSVFGGFISMDNMGRLNKTFRKAKRHRFTDSLLPVTICELLEQSDEQSRMLCCVH